MNHESIASIIAWHTETFPEATLDGQIAKFLEETIEYKTATSVSAMVEELADCFIVACGIARFNPVYGCRYFGDVFSIFTSNNGITVSKLQDAIDAKMEINRQRKWNKGNGEYKHIEEGA